MGWLSLAAPLFAAESLVDLIDKSDLILYGRVIGINDGFAPSDVPHTEINLSVSESLKGEVGDLFSFTQFGVPGTNGEDIGLGLYPKPASLPSWEVGEDVLVFLHSPARLTGFRTTVGLNDGKWKHEGDYLVSTTDLSEILDGLFVEGRSLTTEQLEMLDGKKPRARFAPMMDLLRRAIDERWIEKGLLIHAPSKTRSF